MIKAAFNILYEQGFICRAAIRGDHGDAILLVAKRARERLAKGEPCCGTVFFMAAEVRGGQYPLYFGPVRLGANKSVGMPAVEAAKRAVLAIRRTGGWCEWDGDAQHAIIVKEN